MIKSPSGFLNRSKPHKNNFTRSKIIFILFIALILPVACSSNNSVSIKQMMDEYYYANLEYYPFTATQSGFNEFNDKFDFSITDSVRAELKQLYKNYQLKLDAIDKSELSEEEQLNYELLEYDINLKLKGLEFPEHYLVVDQIFSFPLGFMVIGSGALFVPFKTYDDYQNWLARVKQFPRWVDYAIENMNKGIEEGIVQPKVLIEAALPQLKGGAAAIPEESIFYGPIRNLPEKFSEEQKIELTEKYKKAIAEIISPAYGKLTSYLEETYLPNSRESLGISELPKGEEWYKYRIKLFTSTDLSPDEIFELGMSEVNRLEREMEKLVNEEGVGDKVGNFFQMASQMPGAENCYSEEEIVDAYNRLTEKVNNRVGELFGVVPKTPFEVRPVEKFRAQFASSSYAPAPPDGSSPGIFYLNTFGIGESSPHQPVESLFLHEAIPGHHFQISLQRENKNYSDFRKFQPDYAFLEGWGLYTESLGDELGLYNNFFQKYARYVMEMMRAIRLVVDTGIHHKGWTIEEVVNFTSEKNPAVAGGAYQSALRYTALGGQALAYKIGELKIHEVVENIKSEYPDKFNLKDFHDKLLINGSMPLEIFEKTMYNWADEKYGSTM